MRLLDELGKKNTPELGESLHQFASQLFPICRSITGDGLRQTLAAIGRRIPLRISEVPSGTVVFDWTVPREWNVRDAYIQAPNGRRIVDFKTNNLHVLNYSVPFRGRVSLAELKEHLFTLPDHPDWIPYRTSYYQDNWGFCIPHRQMLALEDGDYEVCIDSSLSPGHLSYGECFIAGRSTDEILISAHSCHPSLANDNLSGIAVATFLAELLSGQELHYSYRFLFAPGTIGAIAWLARNREATARIRHGLVLTGIGDAGKFHYKKSRQGNAHVDRAAVHVLAHLGHEAQTLPFSPYGYDERQYCSPGFNLPVGCLMRSVWGTFPEYHTSADNLSFIHPAQLAESLRVCAGILDVLENDRSYRNLHPYCEPQLGTRNLYRSTGGTSITDEIHARLWVLNLSDGQHTLLDIAERSGLSFTTVCEAANLLQDAGLLEEIPRPRALAAALTSGSEAVVSPEKPR